ncbi:MAG: hypothetical protein RLY57_66 [Candidatus Parcubacteria bacterium]|jgi:UPF0755 protein
MKSRLIPLLQIMLAVYIAGNAFFLTTYYADDIDGVTYALGNKIESVIDHVGSRIDTAAAYIATDDPNLVSLNIVEGWRKEQIAEAFQKKLGWTDEERYSFAEMLQCTFETSEGKLFPTVYTVPKDARPEDVKALMEQLFEASVSATTTDATIASSTPLNMDKVLVVASLIQREAASKKDMNIISGVIWNRVLSDMSLGIDATLQYAKGTEENWWPKVLPEDKDIESPFNTYTNKGLPPHPIANPGIAAIAAAINPADTSCLYYLHDRYGRIHCSDTYAGHKQNINLYLR